MSLPGCASLFSSNFIVFGSSFSPVHVHKCTKGKEHPCVLLIGIVLAIIA